MMVVILVLAGCGRQDAGENLNDEPVYDASCHFHMANALDSDFELDIDHKYIMTKDEVEVQSKSYGRERMYHLSGF